MDFFYANSMLVSEIQKEKIQALIESRKGKLDDHSLSTVFIEIYKDTAYFCTSWGQFLVYEGKYYKRHSSTDIHQILDKLIQEYFPDKLHKISKPFLSSVRELLTIRFPNQIEDTELAHEYIAFEDGLYNTKNQEKLEHTSEIVCFKYISGVEIDKFSDPKPAFDGYITSTLVNDDGVYDPELSELYQEMLGSLFSGNKAGNRAFFLYGDASAGKSVTTEMILSFFETSYTSSASLEALSRPFNRGRLIGKLVNVCTEEESQYLKHDVFKAFITGEQIDAEIKYQVEAVAYHNFAKFIFATNQFPKFAGLDAAMKRRLIVIPFNAKFEGDKRDFQLMDKLQAEKSQIIGFALQGLKRLQENKYQYTIGDSASKAMQFFEEESSPVARYLTEEVEVDEMKMVFPIQARDLYSPYRDWCRENGHTPVASNRFAREMASIDWLKPYKIRTKGVNEYYIHAPQQKAPKPIAENTY